MANSSETKIYWIAVAVITAILCGVNAATSIEMNKETTPASTIRLLTYINIGTSGAIFMGLIIYLLGFRLFE